MKTKVFASLLSITALALSISLADPWDGYNNPEKMSRGRYTYDFSSLPSEGGINNENIPWPETYWPTYKGGLAYRWQTKKPGESWSYHLYSLEELLQMTPGRRSDLISKFSPAEKFDLLQSRYDYPTVMRERARTSPNAADWEGICHGWSPASIRHREPSPKTVTNAEGIEIPFGSSDIKGLISYYYGKVDWKPVGWTNRRCRSSIGGKGCRGVNPGTMHLVITNQLGLLNEAFIMDRDRQREVWNQPFYSYKFSKVGSCRPSRASRRAGADYGVSITMQVKWVAEIRASQWDPALVINPDTGLLGTNSKTNTYRYCLEISGSGRIVGGEWESKERPGFIWNHDTTDFADPYYGRIQELLND